MANEKRLIDANVAKEMIVNHANEFGDVLNRREKALLIGGGISCIDNCPTVDAVEVVHGRWLFVTKGQKASAYACSECNRVVTLVCDEDKVKEHLTKKYPYCHCGAKMDGDGNA